MKRILKISIWTVGILLVLLIALVIVVLLTFDPNKYKPEITAAVQKATGRELAIPGELKLSIFPWLGVETGAMTLSNAPGFGPEPFAKIGSAAIKVQLLPLLKRDVEVDTVTLDGLYLRLMRNSAGHTNWEDLTAQPSQDEPAAPAPADGSAAPALSTFAIGGVRIQDAAVIWDDRQSDKRYELKALSLRTGPISPRAPIALELGTDITSTAPEIAAHLALATQAQYDFDSRQLQLTGLTITTDARGAGLPVDDIKLTLNSDALLKLADDQYQLSGLQLRTALRGDKLPGKRLDTTFQANVAVDLKKDTLTLDKLSLEAWNLKVNGQIHGQGLLETPRFNGTLAVAEFNARELLQRFMSEPIATADPQALGAVGVKLEFKASATDAELPRLEIKLDQTRISGKGAIKNFSRPAYRLQLAVDDIDADRYLPPAAAAGAQPATPAAVAGSGASAVPLETLRALDVEGDLSVAKLKIAKLRVSDIKLGINAKAGVIRAYPLSARLYNGEYLGDLQLNARGPTVQLAMNEALKGVEIGPLTQDLLEKDLVGGTGNVNLKLTGSGLTPDELKRTLNGTLGFRLQNGRANGVNLIEIIQKDYLKYIQGLSIDAGRLNQTVFSTFAATAAVSNGLIETNDLVLNSAQLNIKGRGTVNLVNEQLALRLDATPAGQLAKKLDQFKDTVIPIRVEGTISAPKFATDLDEALKQKVKARLEMEKQKLQAELRQKAEAEKAKLQEQIDRQKQEVQQQLEKKQEQLKEKAQEQLQNKLKGIFK